MRDTLRRSVSVFIAVAITTLVVYGVVRVGGAVLPGATATASVADASTTSEQLQVCPVSGCSATSCHGATGAPPPSRQNSAAASQSSAGQRSATPSQGTGSGSAKVYRCPVSGCRATTCHGANGDPPPSR